MHILILFYLEMYSGSRNLIVDQHQKELVLNAHDTENFLDAMEIVR